MNPVLKKPIPRFSESLTRRRRSAWLDVWAARGITVVAAGVGLATVLVFLLFASKHGRRWSGRFLRGPRIRRSRRVTWIEFLMNPCSAFWGSARRSLPLRLGNNFDCWRRFAQKPWPRNVERSRGREGLPSIPPTGDNSFCLTPGRGTKPRCTSGNLPSGAPFQPDSAVVGNLQGNRDCFGGGCPSGDRGRSLCVSGCHRSVARVAQAGHRTHCRSSHGGHGFSGFGNSGSSFPAGRRSSVPAQWNGRWGGGGCGHCTGSFFTV